MEEGKKGEVGVASSASSGARRLSCIKCFDMLWFCYSPFHQMQQYYRYGDFDNCFAKWNDLFDCLSLKTKKASEVEEILIAREKEKKRIWTHRTVEEASEHWLKMYQHILYTNPPESDS
ncbi:hypothetical protein LUZ61_009181 [Rhynchospora tenuis]|uniref:Uncharacterized protein n=1 Tax=Rhynchospora tenuis TaxID=198213 RepID=A0AAD6EY20_9POAL|nr:hypothetical protein LUZ61_009181 [Rhynchospora tenuis]